MSADASQLPSLTPVICGPTASGKSDLAVALALSLREKHNIPAEIITADAFQVYQGLDIGTAKPTPAQRRGVPHHLIDVVPPAHGTLSASEGCLANSTLRGPERAIIGGNTPLACAQGSVPPHFTLDDWLRLANQTIADLRPRNILPIVVGGTHLYIKALLEGIFQGPEPNHALRAELMAMDPAARRTELESVDPAAAARIHPNDIRRTIRALEVFRLTGKPISGHQTQWDRGESGKWEVGSGKSEPARAESGSNFPLPTSHFRLLVIDWPAEPLNRRINARVKQMMERGLLDEVRSLIERNAFTAQSAEALGYKQLIPIVRAAINQSTWPPPAAAVDEAVEKIKVETRRFGKNQRTWLRRLSTTPDSVRLTVPDAETNAIATPPVDGWVASAVAALGLPR